MLHQHGTPRMLGAARILVYTLWLINVIILPLEDLAAMPLEIQRQMGIMRHLPDAAWAAIHSFEALVALRVVVAAGLVWLVIGLPRYRSVAIATCILLTLFDGIVKGYGYVTHSKFVLLYAAWILAFFPATDALALPRRPEPQATPRHALPLVVIALLLFTSYFFVGALRIDRSGVAILFSDTLRTNLLVRSLEPNPTGFGGGLLIASHAPLMWMANIGFAAVGIAELLSPLCLAQRWVRRGWLAVIVPFHVAVLLTMNIAFWENVALLALFGVDWSARRPQPELLQQSARE